MIGNAPEHIDEHGECVAYIDQLKSEIERMQADMKTAQVIMRNRATDIAAANAKIERMKRVVETAIAAEREACAKVADKLAKLYPRKDIGWDSGYTHGATRVATEIRARSTLSALDGGM